MRAPWVERACALRHGSTNEDSHLMIRPSYWASDDLAGGCGGAWSGACAHGRPQCREQGRRGRPEGK
eukprot:351160-Pyramimonas_sp.AAC.1